MWLFIPYIIVQIVLGFIFQGDFSVLAKSSDIFVIFFVIRSAINASDLDSLFGHFEDYLISNLYQQFRRKYIRRMDSVYYRHIETVILVIASLVFQFLSQVL